MLILASDESTTVVEDDVQIAEESTLTAIEGTVQVGYSMNKVGGMGEAMRVSPSTIAYSSMSVKAPMAAAQTFSINALPSESLGRRLLS